MPVTLDFFEMVKVVGPLGAILLAGIVTLWRQQKANNLRAEKREDDISKRLQGTEDKLIELQTGVIRENTAAMQELKQVVRALPCREQTAEDLFQKVPRLKEAQR